jgi:TolB protein
MELSMQYFTRPMSFKPAFVALLFLILSFLPNPAHALDADVVGGKINPLPIAITPFLAGGGAEESAGTLGEVVTNNLGRSGYFSPIDPGSFAEQITDFAQPPNFDSWKQIQAKALVTGQVFNDGGKIRVEFKLFDVNSQQQIAAQQFTTSPKNLRRIGHLISDAVYKSLTGFDGYFDTRIVYVDESGPKNKRVKKLAIMDQDGFNARALTDGGDIVVTPRFSPNSQEVTFMAIGKTTPRVYLYNIETRQREIVGEFDNMSFAPRFSPDGQHVIMSLQDADGRNSNIFVLDLRSKDMKQLTNTPAINTAPSYSPDGSQITFESDRGGAQQVYVMNADGSGQNRISFGNGRYSTPVWSPDGQNIAFTKQAGGKFSIGVMKPDGSGERILTEGYHNEGPTWAPNGRVLMFFRDSAGENGGSKLFSVDITGYNEQQVPTPEGASDPAWSPRLN